MPRLLTTRISRLIETIAWITATLVAVLPPLAYFFIQYQNIQERAVRDAEVQAVLVGRFVGRYPDSWRYSGERLNEALHDVLNPGSSTSIHDMDGQLITAIRGDDHWPLVRPSAAFYEFGQPAGRITVEASLWPVMQSALVVAALSLIVALGLMLPLARFTLRTLKQAASDLEISEQRFARAMAATADGIWELDLVSGRLAYVSPNTESMLGYPPGSFTQANFKLNTVFVHAEDRALAKQALEAHLTTGRPYVCEVRLRHVDGSDRWMRLQGIVSRDGQGLPLSMVGSLRDITNEREELLRLERLREYQMRLLDTLPDAISIKDANLRFTSVNRAFAAMSGVPVERLIGATTGDFYSAETAAAIEAIDRQVLDTGRPVEIEVPVFHAGHAAQRINLMQKTPGIGPDGEPLVIGIHHDITELRQHRDHLEAMVAAQTADLVRAKEVAEQANQSKSEFLANMSHELRTPMHAILSFARIGHFKAATAPPEKLKAYFEHIRVGGERLLDLVNDLLDLSKLEAGRMQYVMAPLDLRRCAHGVVAELAPLFDGKQLVCRVEADVDDCHVIADHKRMEQVLRNLLGNAIKFSPAGKRISIGIVVDAMPAGRRANDAGVQAALRLSVADEGIGIPEAELDSVFDKFTQSSLTSSGAGGTGLGLAICREIVHAHRGIIRASNRATGGAVFDVLLPLPDKDLP